MTRAPARAPACLLILAAFALSPAPAAGSDVDIPQAKWEANNHPGGGYCVRCALKTLLDHHGHAEAAAKIIPEGHPGSDPWDAERHLRSLSRRYGFEWDNQPPCYGLRDGPPMRRVPDAARRAFVRDCCKQGYGCAVSTMNSGHMVVAVTWDEEHDTLEIIDSNGPRLVRVRLSWWLENDWDGWSIAIYPRGSH